MSLVKPWDGRGDYEPPCQPGDRISASRDGSLIIGRVVETRGYYPGIVGLEHVGGFDLVGWDVTVWSSPPTDRTGSSSAPYAPAAPDGPTLPV